MRLSSPWLATLWVVMNLFVTRDTCQAQAESRHFTVQLLDHSPTMTQVAQITDGGIVLGYREVADQLGLKLISFFQDERGQADLPVPKGFTHVDAQAVSEQGRVVGYATRAVGHPEGSMVGFVWDRISGQSVPLPCLPTDLSCFARDISADGRSIVGYSTGAHPPRMRPCIWEWDRLQSVWRVTPLSTIDEFNPYLVTSGVLISPDGKQIAACITVARLPGQHERFDSSLMLWTKVDGVWQRKLLHDHQPRLFDLSNSGGIVGTFSRDGHELPCAVQADGTWIELPLLEGDIAGAAFGIGAQDIIVGMSDSPHGPEGGPRAVTWQAGQVARLWLQPNLPFSVANCISPRGTIGGYATKVADDEKGAEGQEKTYGFIWSPQPASENISPAQGSP